MKIQAYDSKGNSDTTLEGVAGFLASVLKLDRSRKALTIYSVINYHGDTGNMACTVKPDDDNIAILLDSKLMGDRLLITLSHEMVHVFQFARGLLKPGKYGDRAGYWFWKGEQVIDGSSFPPWELQAYEMEEGLFSQAKKFINQSS